MDKQKDFDKGWEEYKAKRNQEIEELAKVLCVNRKPLKCKDCVIRGMCEFKETAKEVYGAGYRKIPENAVVLTREEYENLGLVVETVQEYESKNGQPVLVKERKVVKKSQTDFVSLLNQEMRELQISQQTRKETADKFAERLKNKLEQLEWGGYVECKTKDLNEVVDEICKEITGGR